jgi:tRNA dimethylallyltransferase
MDIGTGKEWGKGVKIHGYDLVDPTGEFSISKYLKFSGKILEDIWKRGSLPILVGGTGLYVKGAVDGIPTAAIPVNKKLRKRLEEKEIDQLYENLSQLDAVKAGSMNSSDKKNPRRLIRGIEIAQWKLEHGVRPKVDEKSLASVLFIGLSAPKQIINVRIEKRVDERVNRGIEDEIRELIKSGVSWADQSMLALGYRQWRDYFEGEVPKEVVIDEWKREEKKYSKRQMTWFRRDDRIIWFDITDTKYQKEVESLVKKWYINDHGKES